MGLIYVFDTQGKDGAPGPAGLPGVEGSPVSLHTPQIFKALLYLHALVHLPQFFFFFFYLEESKLADKTQSQHLFLFNFLIFLRELSLIEGYFIIKDICLKP